MIVVGKTAHKTFILWLLKFALLYMSQNCFGGYLTQMKYVIDLLIQIMRRGSNRNTVGFGETEIYGFKTFRI